MSRNLCSVSCHECPGGHDHIVLEEKPRAVTEADVGKHFWSTGNYVGLIVAHARCLLCHTLYLAWVDWPGGRGFGHWKLSEKPDGQRFCDLSYRHAFNDEPAPEDLPVFEVEVVTEYRRRPRTRHPYMDRLPRAELQSYVDRWEVAVNSGKTIADELAMLQPSTPREEK